MPDTFDYTQPRRAPWQAALDNIPYITVLLCALCALVTAANFTSAADGTSLWARIGHFASPSPFAIWGGRYDLLVTSMFLHGTILHIAFNLMWLYPLGRVLELTMGRMRYLLFVIASAAVGSCVEILVSGQTGIGASGVVYALFGLMWAGRGTRESWRLVATRKNLEVFIVWGLFCVAATAMHFLNIANGAHGGGFLFGLSIGYLFYSPRRRAIWIAPLAALLIASVVSLTYVPWSTEWTFWKGTQEFERHRYPQAITWFQRSLQRGGAAQANWVNIAAAWQNIAEDAASRHDDAAMGRALREARTAMTKADESAPPADSTTASDSDVNSDDGDDSGGKSAGGNSDSKVGTVRTNGNTAPTGRAR